VLSYADWLAAHIEEWTVTKRGDLVPGISRHYIRINPTDANSPDPHASPDTTMLQVANGGGLHPARNVVGGDFLHLVRFGIRSADDPLIRDSIQIIDRILKRDLPQGPCWRRYNHDGYGEKEDGGAFDGTGVGRCWPILTGERGHYELAAGGDAKPLIRALENFANEGGMLSEQLWDASDLVTAKMQAGQPTGAAMPLCWAHAEYISLVRSCHDGVCFDRVQPAFERYVLNRVPHRYEIWTLRHQTRYLPSGKLLRIICAEEATVVWSTNQWAEANKSRMTHETALNLWFADLPTSTCLPGSMVEFTFFWENGREWEGRDYHLVIT
jgi:glucoamylase